MSDLAVRRTGSRLIGAIAAIIRQACLPALLSYMVPSLCLLWRGHPLRTQLFGPPLDPATSVWYLQWWPYAIHHGLNPFVTDKIWHFGGYNLTWSTSLFFPALLCAPVTYAFGVLATYNLLCITAPALASWAAFHLLRQMSRRTMPAFLGGLVFGFSSYETAQVGGHLNLALIALVPLALLLCKQRYDGTIGRMRFAALLGILAVAQIGTSTEIMLSMSVFGLLGWIVCLVLFEPQGRARLLVLAGDSAIAAAFAALALSPFLYFLFKGLPDIPQEFNPAIMYSMDPLAPIVPTSAHLLGGRLFLPISSQFTGYYMEQGGYLGVLLLCIALLSFQQRSRQRPMLALGAIFALIMTASLGPRLHVGASISDIAMPWSLVAGLPVFGSVLPSRFSLYMGLCVALLVTFWLTTPASSWKRYPLAFAGVLLLLPDPAVLAWYDWPTDPFFTPQNIARELGAGANVLILPFAQAGPGMAWQIDAGMTFSQAAGYGGYIPRHEAEAPAVVALSSGTVPPGFADMIAEYCDTRRVGFVLIGSGTPPPTRKAFAQLGWPNRQSGDVVVLTVPTTERLAYSSITGDYWPSGDGLAWMGQAITVRSHGKATQLRVRTLYRPPAAGRPGFSVLTGGQRTHYDLDGKSDIDLVLPANADAVLRADNVFIPDRLVGNHDLRRLSLVVQVLSSS